MRVNFSLGVFLFIFLFGFCSTHAEQSLEIYADSIFEGSPRAYDENRIAEYKKDSDYNYEEDAEYEQNVFSKLLYKFLNWLSEATGLKLGYGLFQLVKWLLIGIATYLMIRFFLNSSLGGIVKKKELDISAIESTIVDADMSEGELTDFVADAEQRKDYRLAIRFSFLKLLRMLDDKEFIFWQQGKTNAEFSKELSGSPFKKEFDEISRLYEFVWYGEFDLDNEEVYFENKAVFENMYSKLVK